MTRDSERALAAAPLFDLRTGSSWKISSLIQFGWLIPIWLIGHASAYLQVCRPGYLKSCDEAAPALRLMASIFRAWT
jgi:hypothetical protein